MEFSLIAPIFFIMVMGIMEFGFAFNATLGANFASRDAALLAAEAGKATGADCVILKSVEDAISAPANDAQIQEVMIFRSNRSGDPQGDAATRYTRSGSKTCVYPDGNSLHRAVYRLVQRIPGIVLLQPHGRVHRRPVRP